MASKLYLGNLPHGITDGALSDFVTTAGFAVASAMVIRDKLSVPRTSTVVRPEYARGFHAR